MKKNTIEFHYKEINFGEEHHMNKFKPLPAEECIPQWFKDLDNPVTRKTVKTCRGVYDAMTSGYIVFWPFDALIQKDEGGRLWIMRHRDEGRQMFAPHVHEQLGPYPSVNFGMQKYGVEKLVTSFRLKTNKGTSIMMVQPPYRPDLKTEIMPGIVDTDKFYMPLNILFTIKDIEVNKPVKIASGTPLAQIIPFVRSEWEIEYKDVDEREFIIQEDNVGNIERHYARSLWTKKMFKRKAK
jgi:hypothetical protein